MNQLDLLDIAPNARPSDPETAVEAANAHPALRGADRKAALLAHAAHPFGLTDFELSTLIGRQQTSAGKRRGELRDAGLIAQTEIKRPSPSGTPALVWRITQDGLALARTL